MRSRISWIKLLKEEDLSMKLTRSESVLRLKRWNCNLLLKKQRQHWNKRRTKFSGAKWSSLTRIAEKDEEFGMVRKNQAKALDSMQAALETEAKGKAEALRMKKKLEADAADL